ncbi:hypothetical protein ACH5RR_012387 [Cinchona calisaya]|uniref:Uncharacterized protein n=1 Tax=Cinchona calisaya TaxID=153742 RepID=A0ABD3A7I1_9GENT
MSQDPSTHSSQCGIAIGSTTSKRLIVPRDNEFDQQHDCVKTISRIIKSSFNGPYRSCKQIPQGERDLRFREFGYYYYWLPKHEYHVCKVFEHRGSLLLRNKMLMLRKSRKKPG